MEVKSWSEPEAMTKAGEGERDEARKPAKSEERRARLEKELRANLLKPKARLKTATTEADDGH
jgi:hypothetical protein